MFIVVVFPRFPVLGFAGGGHPVEPADSVLYPTGLI